VGWADSPAGGDEAEIHTGWLHEAPGYWKDHFGGKEMRPSFCVYPDVGLKAVREKRHAARQLSINQSQADLTPSSILSAQMAMQAAFFVRVAIELLSCPQAADGAGFSYLRRLQKQISIIYLVKYLTPMLNQY
jgi:hypothetical protein